MNDKMIIKRYYETKLEEVSDLPPPDRRISAIANSHLLHTASKWETLLGLMVTCGYLWYFINPVNWFSLGRFVLGFINGLSFSRFVFTFNIGF
jgi:hypothetical protein